MPLTPRRTSTLLRSLRTWGPVLVLSVVVIVAAGIVAVGLRTTPVSPARPIPVSSGSWAPFVGPQLPDGGPVARLVVQVLRQSGYSPEISYANSWSLAEEQVTSGASVGVFPLVGSATRRARLLLSDPLVDFEYVLFYDRRRGTPRVATAADLAALRVGRVAGYDYWSEFEAAATNTVRFESALDAFRALADGKVDVVAEGLLSGQAVLTDPAFAADATDFDHLRGDGPLVHSVQGLYFMMPRTSEAAAVMRRFNRELARTRRSPEYADIVAQLKPSEFQEVSLAPVGATGLVELLDAAGRPALLAPQGTRARVLSWPEQFGGAAAGTPGAPGSPGGPGGPGGPDGPGTGGVRPGAGRVLVQVKITNGPARGRVLYVDARALLLERSGS